MMARTSGAIALRPTGNIQGSHYFLNVIWGRRVARNNWMALPMPNEIIHAVHRLAAACKKYKGIVFTDSKGKIIDDNSPEKDEDIIEITGVGNTYPTSSIPISRVITGVDTNPTETTIDTNGNGNTTSSILISRVITGVDTNPTETTIDTNGNGTTNSITGVATDGNNNTTSENEETTNENGNTTNENKDADEHTTNTGNLVDMYDEIQEDTQEGSPAPELLEIHTTQEAEDDDNHTHAVPTRHKIEIIQEMNATNMRQDTESTSGDADTTTGNSATHGYNLRPRPTKRHKKISLAQTTRQPT